MFSRKKLNLYLVELNAQIPKMGNRDFKTAYRDRCTKDFR